VKITTKGARADGSKIDTVVMTKYDGKEVPVTGTGLAYDTVSLKQVNASALTAVRTKKGTKYHVTVQYVISADGKTMTQSTTGVDADGKPLTATAVYDKQ
jgi:putative IMPACT (imprinted ancient) family translation regulator